MNSMDLKDTDLELTKTKCYYIEKETPKGGLVYLFLKRAFDIAGSFTLGLALLPVMLIIALLVCLDSRGGVIYRQERLGKNGKCFYMLKFRTMRADAPRGRGKAG